MSSEIEKPPRNWVPVAGRWNLAARKYDYLGPDLAAMPAAESPHHGILVSDCRSTDLDVSLKVRIEGAPEGDSSLKGSSAGIVLGYRPHPPAYTTATLGGYDRACAIDEYVDGIGWRMVAGAGSVASLTPRKTYSLRAKQVGQRVTVDLDGVRILDQVLSGPLPSSQLGLFGYGSRKASFWDVAVRTRKPKVFVVMRFCEPFDTLYRVLIRHALKKAGLRAVRADELVGPGIIFQDIQREIAEASIVIAEISAPDRNENVFYELGYAHALSKPTILLADRGSFVEAGRELPFDIRSYRVIFYDNSIGGNRVVKEQLRSHIRAIKEKL